MSTENANQKQHSNNRVLPRWLRTVIPVRLRRRGRGYLSNRLDNRFRGRPIEQIFRDIYAEGLWGSSSTAPGEPALYSGPGSHERNVTDPYIAAVRLFLATRYPNGTRLVDLGCGDFHVGKELVDLAVEYTACVVVGALVERNRTLFPGVVFQQTDLTTGPVPAGDVGIIRQVLQHLSNADIGRVLAQLHHYRWLIVTEALPVGPFAANRDKSTGPGIRPWSNSGVVLTEAPFSLRVEETLELCRVHDGETVIVTLAYRQA